MKQNHLLIALRNMMKNKLFILINVFGMGVAIAQCIVGYFAHEYDASFDFVHENRERVYRVSVVREFENKLTKHGYACLPLGDLVDKTFTDVNHSSRYHRSFSNFKLADDLFPANISYVDPDFFQLFSFEFMAGSSMGLKDKTSVLLSEKTAIRLFGSTVAAMGKSVTQVFGQELKEVQVAGVFKDPPMNSSFYKPEGGAFLNFENFKDEYRDIREDDWKVQTILFLRINDEGRVNAVAKQLQPFIVNNNKVREDFQIKEFVLDPFSTLAHRDRAGSVRTGNGTWSAPPISAVIGSNVMGILVLLLACFNLTNTSIATSSRRLKEIGIRKVMGSSRTQLVFQFIGETMCICLLAVGVGVLLSDFMVRGWNIMWQYFQLTPDYLGNTKFLLFLFGLVLFTGLAAGSYPAFYISKFNPVAILKGKLRFGGTNNFTRVLLGLQFSISLVSIVSAIGFFQNARYQRAYDLGFNPNGAVLAFVNDQSEFETYRNELQSNPAIISMAGAKSGIFSNRTNDPVKHESKQLEVDIIEVGDNYLSTMGLTLVEGRDFVKDSETDRKESVIVTQKMANAFGWDKPLGKEIIWRDTVKLFVIGVVRDVYTAGLWRELEPMMIRYVLPGQYTQLVVSTGAGQVASVNTFMNEAWNKIFPNRLYDGHMLSESVVEVQNVNNNIVYMFGFMGAITLLLSATGLFTLVSLNIIKRMKEIGVRKLLGASVANITRIVNAEFVIILALASALGSLGGYIQSDLIMGSIWKYYQGPGVATIVVSVSILFVISFVAIGNKIFKTATMNPVESLKEE
jgi:putative ABC transport system permease protein